MNTKTLSTDTSPEQIFHAATGFMAAKYLFVAVETDLFQQLAVGAATLDQLAERTSLPKRTLRVVIDAMVVLGLVEKSGVHYENTPVAQAYLTDTAMHDLRPFLKFWNRFSYPAWAQLEDVVRSAQPLPDQANRTHEDQEVISRGIEAVSAASAKALAKYYDFKTHHRVLDLGGGTGSFLVAAINAYKHLQGTLFEQPHVVAVARNRINRAGLAQNIMLAEGDFFQDTIPGNHDAVIVANVMHIFSPEHNRTLLARIRGAVENRTRLLLVDFWTDPTHTEPFMATMLAGEFLLASGEGDVYSREEVEAWLGNTGWRPIQHILLDGPASLIVAETSD